MDAVELDLVDSSPARYENGVRRFKRGRKASIRKVEVSEKHYSLEVYEDDNGETWVRVKTGSHLSKPIPFLDFIIANQYLRYDHEREDFSINPVNHPDCAISLRMLSAEGINGVCSSNERMHRQVQSPRRLKNVPRGSGNPYSDRCPH